MKKTSTVLRQALAVLKGGEAWCKRLEYDGSAGRRCMVGALDFACAIKRYSYWTARDFLVLAVGTESLRGFNDHPARTFEHIQAAFLAAIAIAERREAKS